MKRSFKVQAADGRVIEYELVDGASFLVSPKDDSEVLEGFTDDCLLLVYANLTFFFKTFDSDMLVYITTSFEEVMNNIDGIMSIDEAIEEGIVYETSTVEQ